MSFLRLAYIVALRRTAANWKLEVVLLLGIVLTVALMSSGVIFSDMVAEAALGHALEEATPEEANFRIRSFIGRETPPTVAGRISAYRNGLNFIDNRVGSPFQPYLQARARLLETPTFFFQGHPQLVLDDEVRPRGDLQFLEGLWPERAKLLQGRWPYTGETGIGTSAPDEVEVVVDVLGAELLQLGTGDEMEIFPAASFTDPPPMTAKIVGIFQRTDPEDEFWYGADGDFSFQNERWTIIPLFTTETAIFQRVVGQYPSLFLDINWFFYLDRHEIRGKDVKNIQSISRTMKLEVYANLSNGSIAMKLDRVLKKYEDQLLPTRVPLFLILFLVTGILIYYLGLIAGLVVKSRSTELAMLKGRGATTSQLGLLALVESLLLAIPAVAVGPFLAQGVVQLLGKIFFGLGGGGELAAVPVALSSQAFLLGLAGGLLSVAALTGFTLLASRQGIVEFRQTGARPPQVPFFHRYYLDILLLVPIIVVWWQVQSQDAFLARSLATGELEIDYSHILVPVLGLLAIGLLVLRFFPKVLALSARIIEPVGPSWLVHGLRHVARDPIVPGVLVVMLMLATALGVIGSTFSSTLERSQRDQALYETGADLRIEHGGIRTSRPLLGFADLFQKVDSVEDAAEVQRIVGSLLTEGFSPARVSILGVNTENFDRVAWYRHDFGGGRALEEITALIKPQPVRPDLKRDGIVLPEDTSALTLWVQPSRPDRRLAMRARLKDASGLYFDVFLSTLGFRGWQKINAPLIPLTSSGRRSVNPLTGSSPQPPLSVLKPPFSFQLINVSRAFGSMEPGALFLGELSAVTPAGEVLVDDFQDMDRWQVLQDHTQPGVGYYVLEKSELATPQGGARSALFSWSPGGIGLKGVKAGKPEGPVPALVSRSLLEAADAQVGDTLNISLFTYALAFRVAGVVSHFPTLDPAENIFAVVDLKTLNRSANLHSPRALGGSNELWVNLGDGAGDIAAVTSVLTDNGIRLRGTRLASDLVAQNVDQPLINAGWGALLVLVFLVLVLASASGVMLFSYIDARERQTEFALLRTLGSSTKQLNGVVWFSISMVVVCGIGLGSWVGFQTGASLLPLMEVAEQGTQVVPPMTLQTNWTTLLVSYLVLVGVTAATFVWLAWFSARMEIQRALRIGE